MSLKITVSICEAYCVSLVKILQEIGQIMKIMPVKGMVSASEAYMQRKVNEYIITERLHLT